MRACVDCGELEKREQDRVNLDPVTGRCIPCLIRYWQGDRARQSFEVPKADRDWARLAAAMDDDDD